MITHLLNRVADWKRDQPTGDKGRWTESLVTIQADLPVRLRIAGAAEKVVGGDRRTEATHVFYTDPDATGILRDDVLVIEGKSYRVMELLPPSKPEHHLKWLACEQQTSVPA